MDDTPVGIHDHHTDYAFATAPCGVVGVALMGSGAATELSLGTTLRRVWQRWTPRARRHGEMANASTLAVIYV